MFKSAMSHKLVGSLGCMAVHKCVQQLQAYIMAGVLCINKNHTVLEIMLWG